MIGRLSDTSDRAACPFPFPPGRVQPAAARVGDEAHLPEEHAPLLQRRHASPAPSTGVAVGRKVTLNIVLWFRIYLRILIIIYVYSDPSLYIYYIYHYI